jgi:anti-anti-sigma regulatory factor
MEEDSELVVSVVTDDNGPLILLAGEIGLATIGRLTHAVADQLAAGVRYLRIDMAEVRSLNSEAIWFVLVVAATLNGQAGGLELVRPRTAIAAAVRRADTRQLVTIR